MAGESTGFKLNQLRFSLPNWNGPIDLARLNRICSKEIKTEFQNPQWKGNNIPSRNLNMQVNFMYRHTNINKIHWFSLLKTNPFNGFCSFPVWHVDLERPSFQSLRTHKLCRWVWLRAVLWITMEMLSDLPMYFIKLKSGYEEGKARVGPVDKKWVEGQIIAPFLSYPVPNLWVSILSIVTKEVSVSFV